MVYDITWWIIDRHIIKAVEVVGKVSIHSNIGNIENIYIGETENLDFHRELTGRQTISHHLKSLLNQVIISYIIFLLTFVVFNAIP